MAFFSLLLFGYFSAVFAQTPNCTSGEGKLVCTYIGSDSVKVLQDALTNMAPGTFWLSISFSDVLSFPDDIFANSNLSSLSFVENYMFKIPVDKLRLIQSQVTSLSFMYEGITMIGKEDLDFPFKGSVRYLSLDNNQIERIEPGSFRGYSSVETIYLSRNVLTHLEDGVFDGLSSVKQMHLWKSQISQIDVRALSGLTSLQRLELYSNPLQTLRNGTFDGLPDFGISIYVAQGLVEQDWSVGVQWRALLLTAQISILLFGLLL